MAAYDNVSLPSPPNIAQAGNYAQMLMQGLSALGSDYQSGKNFQYEQRQRDLFQNPDNRDILDSAISSGDYKQLLTKLIQSGGGSTAMGAIPLLQKQPFLDAALKEYKADSGQGANTGPAASPAAAGPANITGQTGRPQGQPSAPGDAAAETVRTLTAGIANGRNVPDAAIANYARALGVDPDAPLSAAQQARATQIIGNNLRGSAPTTGSQPNPVPQAGLAGDDNNTNQGTPVGVGGGAPISPAPTSASGNIGGAPSGGRQPLAVTVRPRPRDEAPSDFAGRFAGAQPQQDPAAGIVPRGFSGDSRDFAAALRKRAEALRRQANTQGIIGIPTKPKEDQALAYDKQADAIDAAWKQQAEQTQEQKNVGTGPGGPPADVLKHEIESGQKEFDSINELGDNARQSSQKLRLAQAYVNSDEYYSGPVETLNRKMKQWAATFGGDPNAGTPQEAMVKSINDLLAEQVRAMAKSGVGRVLMTEVQTMRDSIASQKITPATNRLLLEEVGRVHRAQTEIQDAANLYVKQHGHLDAGFRQIVTKYYHDNPMFSDAEIQDPRLIAPPVAPAGMDAAATAQWAKSRGLKRGDPVLTQEGARKAPRDRVMGQDIIGAP